MADLTLRCNACNKLLDGDFSRGNLYVDPCKFCIEEAEEETEKQLSSSVKDQYDEGYNDGLTDGIAEGVKQAEEKYDSDMVTWSKIKDTITR